MIVLTAMYPAQAEKKYRELIKKTRGSKKLKISFDLSHLIHTIMISGIKHQNPQITAAALKREIIRRTRK